MNFNELAEALDQVSRSLQSGDATIAVGASRAAAAVCERAGRLAAPLDEEGLLRAKALYGQCLVLVAHLQQQMQQQSEGLAQSQRAHNAYQRSAGGD